jgi:hypothetical protein
VSFPALKKVGAVNRDRNRVFHYGKVEKARFFFTKKDGRVQRQRLIMAISGVAK